MLEKYEGLLSRLKELENLLSDPKILADRSKYQTHAREHSSLAATVDKFEQYKKVLGEIAEANQMMKDPNSGPDATDYLKSELESLEAKKKDLELKIKAALLPKDENIGRNVIVEIRPAAGGEESSIFSSDLFRLYTRYAESQGWKMDVLSSSPTGLKGFKEIIFSVEGPDAYQNLRFEAACTGFKECLSRKPTDAFIPRQ